MGSKRGRVCSSVVNGNETVFIVAVSLHSRKIVVTIINHSFTIEDFICYMTPNHILKETTPQLQQPMTSQTQ